MPISAKLSNNHHKVMEIQVRLKEGPRPFPKGDNYEIAKVHYSSLKIFSRTTMSISTKLGTAYPRVKGTQGPFNYQKGYAGVFSYEL